MNRQIFPLAIALLAASCGSPEKKIEEPTKVTPKKVVDEDHHAPSIEYDLGPVSPDILKRRYSELKSPWNDCYLAEHKKHEQLAGQVAFSLRTRKDGSVKWAFVKASDIGSRVVEKCMLDAIRAVNWGVPMDAREGEVPELKIGWALDDEERPADEASSSNVIGPINANKARIEACKKGVSAKFTATIYVQKGGKPKSVGVSTNNADGEDAADCIAEVLGKLTYTNRSSWITKVTVDLP